MEHADKGCASSHDPTSGSPCNVPPPIAEPRFKLDETVTPSTIFPTCYFTVKKITYSEPEQAYLYTIKSLPFVGDHYQPDLTRTVFEDILESQTNIRKRNELLDMEGKTLLDMTKSNNSSNDEVGELRDVTNKLTINTSSEIEVGDIVDVRVNSPVIDEFLIKVNPNRTHDEEEWLRGTVVGTNTQHGLWECFFVTLEKVQLTNHALPCTQRLLKLVQKGSQSTKKKRSGNMYRVGGPGGAKTRTLRPVLLRRETGTEGVDEERIDLKLHRIGPNGICFGDAGKLG